ncbi:MAG: molybdopterin-dependent oxidoreductase [Deltaproteobacteria bacterium]|nr:molybdopterin-dependent oxidoreductase [Deltaproteobacteria bacterium]
MKRRKFIKLLGGSTTFALAYGYGLFPPPKGFGKAEALKIGEEDLSLRPPEEKWVPTVCRQCQGGCGILVRVIGNRAVKIDGNPLHPINRGRLCARGQSGLQFLYDPDRIRGPLIRKGERGEDRWESVSWDKALTTLQKKLKILRNKKRPESLVMLSGIRQGLAGKATSRFMEAYGSPNLITSRPDLSRGFIPAVELMQGAGAGITYDIENANYILSFNSGLLEDHWSPVQIYQAYGKFRRERKGVRGKLVQVEPRLSVTAAKADQWIPVKPGTEGVLAMGIASVLIIERRYDESFLRNRTFGFEDWADSEGTIHPGFKTLVIQEYPLDQVEKTTGVPRDTIVRIAREFADHGPALAIGNDAFGVGNPGLYNRMAIHALNALAGNIQKDGGIRSNAKQPDLSLPPQTPDAVARQGLSKPRIDGAGTGRDSLTADLPENIPDRILEHTPYPVEILLLHHANALYDSTEPDKLQAALKEVPFIASFSSFLDETTRYADLILPDSIYLEKWDLDATYTLKGNPVVNLSRPVLPPVFNTRDTVEVLAALSRKLGGSPAEAFPASHPEGIIQAAVRKLHRTGQGEPFGAPLEELWTKLLEQSGWKVRNRETFDNFWSKLRERGGWWDPVYYPYEWRRVFSTPSGRFEFFSLTVKKYLEGLGATERDLALNAMPQTANMKRADAGALPHGNTEKPGRNEERYPFEIHPYVIPILSHLHHTNEPWLQDITGFHLYQSWHTWVEINPKDAHEQGIGNGEWVTVESSRGKIRARARLFEGVMPHVINLPVGLGHEAGGRWTAGIGENVPRLLQTKREPVTGKTRYARSRARLIRNPT